MAGRRWRRLGGLVLAAFLAATAGCLSFVNPVVPAPHDDVQACREIPAYCRNRTYIFFFQGLDPAFASNLDGVRDYAQSLGFIKTYFGYFYHPWYFHREAVRIHREEPDARFVLVGFSFGANAARGMANMLRDDNIPVDLLVYYGGNTFDNTPDTTPDNVVKVINVLATGFIWNGADLDRADNIHYDDCWHFGSPAHPKSTDRLTRELAEVALRVAVPYREQPAAPPAGPLPPGDTLPPPTLQGPQAPRLPAPAEQKGDGGAPKPNQVGAGDRPLFRQTERDLPREGQRPAAPAAKSDEWSFLQPESAPPTRGGGAAAVASGAPAPDFKEMANKPK